MSQIIYNCFYKPIISNVSMSNTTHLVYIQYYLHTAVVITKLSANQGIVIL